MRGLVRPLLVFAGSLAWVAWIFHSRPMAPDFSVLYAAGTPGPVYDTTWLTSLQSGPGPRPFAYPPTVIPLLRAIHLLPYGVALSLWCAASMTVFVEATARLVRHGAWLVLLSPLCVFASLAGQTTLFLGSLLVFGFTAPPLMAGVLFGLAFSIKPQIMLLLPVVLALERNWRALLAMMATGAVLCLISLSVGPHYWLDWVVSLASFNDANRSLSVPLLGAPVMLVPAIALAAVVLFLRADPADTPSRLIALIAGSLLISPHAVSYEAALLIPATVAIMLGFSWRSLIAIAAFATLHAASWMLATYAVLICLWPMRRFRELGAAEPCG